MATVNTIVVSALRLCRQRDTTNATRLDEAREALNNMLKGWEEILHHSVVKEYFTLTAGTGVYTIGEDGDFDTIRPMGIVSAYIEDSGGIDYEVSVIAKEDYDAINNKSEVSRPDKLFYNPTNPLGTIYFNYLPESAETFYLTSFKEFTEYAALEDTILEPVEYEKAMIYNLAVDLAPEYGIQLQQTVIEQSIVLKNAIMNRNSSTVPEMNFDFSMLRK